MRRIVTLVLMMLIGGYGAAQTQTNPTDTSTQTGNQGQGGNQTPPNRQTPTETETATKEFLGLKWGAGIGVMGSFGGGTAVEKASVVGTDKIVRVDEEGDFRPQMFLEMHVFVGKKARCWREYQQKMATWRDEDRVSPQHAEVSPSTARKKGKTICPEWKLDEEPRMPDPPLRGVGPFIALQGSDNKPIDALTLGVMMGFRKEPKATNSVNVGIGLSFDPSVQVLGHGIKEGKPLPAGETTVRFKKEGRFGWAVMTSFTF